VNQICRHMAFDDITFNQRRVTRAQRLRDSVLAFKISERLAKHVLFLDLESAFFQVHDPAIAALSGWGLVDGN
jgi:hypothetical protein